MGDTKMNKEELRKIIREELKLLESEKKTIDVIVHYTDDITGKIYKSDHKEYDWNKKEFDKVVSSLKKAKRKIKGANWSTGQIEYST